jgi:hypothetical protein
MNEELEKFMSSAEKEENPKDLKLILDFQIGVSAFAGKPLEIDVIKYRTKKKIGKQSEIDLSKRKKQKSKNSLF